MIERAGFDAYVRQHIRDFVRYAILLCRDEAPALDITQDALIKIRRAWQRNGELAKSYGYPVIHTVFIDHYRKNGRSAQIDLGVEMPDRPQTSDVDTDVTEERSEDVRSAVRELPAPLQRVVFLKYYAGHSNPMISEYLGISSAQVSRDLYRAHATLQKKLKQWDHKREGG